jgi:hypothetical protein
MDLNEKYLFIVTSAIMAGNGKPDERFIQTLYTIDSIRLRVPNVDIWLCESSTRELLPYMKELLDVKILDFSRDTRVHEIVEYVKFVKLPVLDNVRDFYELSLIKNLTESYVINRTLEQIDSSVYSRIFKISGRYFLTNRFNLKDHLVKNKIVLKPRIESLLGANYIKSNHFRYCVTWDFCTSIFKEMQESFQQIEEYIKSQSSLTRLGDIEHGLSLFIPDEFVHEIEKTGIVGMINNGDVMHSD